MPKLPGELVRELWRDGVLRDLGRDDGDSRELVGSKPSDLEMPPVGLNHFFVAVGDDVLSAIRSSEFLREHFATVEERVTVSAQPRPASWVF